MENAAVNSRPRQTLAGQIDRLDSILDGLDDALAGAVADAVRAAVSLAVREAVEAAVKDVLSNPHLLRAAMEANGLPRPGRRRRRPRKRRPGAGDGPR
jgi:hypothetical protein